MATTYEPVTKPVELALTARNLIFWVVLCQFWLLVNGEYLGLGTGEAGAASVYLFGPPTLVWALTTVMVLDTGKPVTWAMLSKAMEPRRDFLSDYIRRAGWSVRFSSVGVQLTYFALAAGISGIIFMFMILHGAMKPMPTPVTGIQSILLVQLILVVPSETLMFHAVVPYATEMTFKGSQYCLYLTYGISQGIFAVFHYGAYGGFSAAMLFVAAFGCLLLYFARSFGLPFAAGIHLSYNLALLGVLIPAAGA